MIEEDDKKRIQQMIDASIGKAVDYSVRKLGDTPTDDKQLTPKGYVDAQISSYEFSTYMIQSNIESLDGWSITAGVFNTLGYLEVTTTASSGNVQSARVPTDQLFGLAPNQKKNPIFQCIAATSGSNYDARVGMGDLDSDNGLGFKMTASTVYALYFDAGNVEHTVALPNINPQTLHGYKVQVSIGSLSKWYVDGNLLYTLDIGNNPVALSTTVVTAYAKTNTTATATIALYNKVVYKQDF